MRKKSPFRRIVGILILVTVAGFVLPGLISGVVKMLTHPPSVQDAPWMIQTTTLTYYAKEFAVVKGSPAITDYWYKEDKWYTHVDGRKKPKVATPDIVEYQGKWWLVFLLEKPIIVRRAQ